MTTEELRALVASIDISTHTPPIKLLLREEGGRVGIQAVLDGVRGSESGADGLLVKEPYWMSVYGDDGLAWADESMAIETIYEDILVPLVTHELAEHFLVGGKPWKDPHE